jgi:pilus assembly protein CpaB
VSGFLDDQAVGPTVQAPAEPAVQVVVAMTNLQAGKVLLPEDLKWQPWPGTTLDESYIVQRDGQGAEMLEELTGTVVKRGIMSGEPVTYGKVFKRDQAGFLSGMLTPGKRALSVPISPILASAGFILPGDRVDVMLQLQVAEGSAQGGAANRKYSETILEDVRVLAIDQNLNDIPEGSVAQVGGTATLEVTPKEAEMLTVARVMGTMSLVLRSLTPGDVAERDQPYTSDLEVSRSISRNAMPDSIQVLGAGRDLEPGTLLRARDVVWTVVPRQLVQSGFFVKARSSISELYGALVTAPAAAGVPFDAANIMKPSEPGFLSVVLPPGKRGISVSVSDVTGVAGYIVAGDRVDVLMTHEIEDKDDDPILSPRRFTETIIRNIRVIAVSTRIDQSTGRPISGDTFTLEATPKESQILTLAPNVGDISFTLAGTGDEPYTRSPTPFTADLEISDAIIAMLVRAEEIYRLREPELPALPPFNLKYPRVPDIPAIRTRRRQLEAAEEAAAVAAAGEVSAEERAKTDALEARIIELQAMMEAQAGTQNAAMQAKIDELQAQLAGEAVPTEDLGGPTSVKVYRASESTTIEFHQ